MASYLRLFFLKNFELLFWVTGLLILFFMPVGENHFSLCPVSGLGWSWCPGCGLGHSIHYYLHLDFSRGWQEHYLGALAIPVIFYRIFQLSFFTKIKQNQSYEQQNL